MSHASPATDSPDPAASPEAAPIRVALRAATLAVHERMHRHPGFAALADGTIADHAYRALLARLHGFHLVFERLAGEAPQRSLRLAADLGALGIDAGALPLCPGLPPLPDAASRLGAAYVVEGAALGGRVMARALAPRPELAQASRFLTGDGPGTGARWSGFLHRLDAGLRTPAQHAAAIASAVAVFAVFERWMERGPDGT